LENHGEESKRKLKIKESKFAEGYGKGGRGDLTSCGLLKARTCISTFCSCGLHLLLFEYVMRKGEWDSSIQKEEAGGLEFHLGH
jgi:hypothetical protein